MERLRRSPNGEVEEKSWRMERLRRRAGEWRG
jgi:hypothetical protein